MLVLPKDVQKQHTAHVNVKYDINELWMYLFRLLHSMQDSSGLLGRNMYGNTELTS